jgi:hypothetical protein
MSVDLDYFYFAIHNYKYKHLQHGVIQAKGIPKIDATLNVYIQPKYRAEITLIECLTGFVPT